MKKLAVAVALMFGVVGMAQAGVYCKNEKGQTYEWHIGWDRPDNSGNFGDEFGKEGEKHKQKFEHTNLNDVICIVNAETYRSALPVLNLPNVPGMDTNAVAGRDGAGVIYRGDSARFIIDNLPSVYGDYATKAYYNDANP